MFPGNLDSSQSLSDMPRVLTDIPRRLTDTTKKLLEFDILYQPRTDIWILFYIKKIGRAHV